MEPKSARQLLHEVTTRWTYVQAEIHQEQERLASLRRQASQCEERIANLKHQAEVLEVEERRYAREVFGL